MPKAIFSVYDKTAIEFAGKVLQSQGFDIYATPGTLRYLNNYQIQAFPVEDYCLNPQGFNDYFSSLSFNTLVGVLTDHSRQVKDFIIDKIDVVVYNFVPTWKIISNVHDFDIKNVDLGGPTIVRAAAINYKNTIPIISPSQYPILKDLYSISLETRIALARNAFDYCSWYDQQLSQFLESSYLSSSILGDVIEKEKREQ